MAEANFNLVLHPEARFAAQDFHEKLNIPSIELRRMYQLDKIQNQYHALAQTLGVTFDDTNDYRAASETIERFKTLHPDTVFAVGEWLNADPFELSLARVRYGFKVSEIYGTITEDNFAFIRLLAKLSPDTKVYSNTEPTMLYYADTNSDVTVSIGKDAGYYHPACPNIPWNDEKQPFGYAGVCLLFKRLTEVMA